MEEIKKENDLFIARYKRLQLIYSLLRATLFVMFIVPFFVYFNFGWQISIQLTLLVGFLGMVLIHQKINRKLAFYEKKSKIIADELIRRSQGSSEFNDGFRFNDNTHYFANDLNIFGPFSLFQNINRSYSQIGKLGLANVLLQNEVSPNENKKRQHLIKELENHEGWLIDLFTHSYSSSLRYDISIPDFKIDKPQEYNYPFWLPIVQGCLCVFLIVSSFFNVGIAFFVFIIASIISYRFNRKAKKFIFSWSKKVTNVVLQCSALENLTVHAVSLKIDNPLYFDMVSGLKGENGFLHKSRHLQKWVNALFYSNLKEFGSSSNIFYQLPNQLFALDNLFVFLINRWMTIHSVHLKKWLNAVSNVEAFSSIAMYSLSKKESFNYPMITDTPFLVEALNLRHPLLGKSSVPNPVSMNKKHPIKIITGSNMSGKSTYLRSIGVTLTLAKTGSRVLADSFSYYPHQIFTSFEIHDSLVESTSSFLAEVKRLKVLIESIENGESPLFLLDEILRGTNSKDRIQSSFEFIQRLKKTDCFGLITTHDLALPEKLMNEMPHSFFYFSSAIDNHSLTFDYSIKKGICPESNGTLLMKREGII